MTIIVNLYAGPGVGKSTTAAGTFHKLKSMGVSCEYVTEYAKDKVWEESFGALSNQIYVFAKQHHRLFRCMNKVDVIINDSPLLFSLIYGSQMSTEFKNLVKYEHNSMSNLDVYLERIHDYDQAGRMQTFDEAVQIDQDIKLMLDMNHIHYHTVRATHGSSQNVVDLIQRETNVITQLNTKSKATNPGFWKTLFRKGNVQ